MNKYFSKLILLSLFLSGSILFLTNCSNQQGADAFEAASKKVKDKKFAEAAQDFEKIVKNDPKSEYAAKSMLELAALYSSHSINNFQRDEDYKKAFDYYTKVYNEYNDSPEGGKACFEIGKYYQSMLEPNLTKEQSMRKAIANYEIVINKYSSIHEAEPALFMIGFIHGNELNQPDSAKIYYQKFVDKYPGSNLAKSARMELQTLGQKPEDILNQKQQKVN